MNKKNLDTDEKWLNDPDSVFSRERKALNISKDDEICGLALSGGGIRSAAFGLGVIQALIAAKLIEKFDYLSTVSGGGYIGSALTWGKYKLNFMSAGNSEML